jgi:hypothetical protein
LPTPMAQVSIGGVKSSNDEKKGRLAKSYQTKADVRHSTSWIDVLMLCRYADVSGVLDDQHELCMTSCPLNRRNIGLIWLPRGSHGVVGGPSRWYGADAVFPPDRANDVITQTTRLSQSPLTHQTTHPHHGNHASVLVLITGRPYLRDSGDTHPLLRRIAVLRRRVASRFGSAAMANAHIDTAPSIDTVT